LTEYFVSNALPYSPHIQAAVADISPGAQAPGPVTEPIPADSPDIAAPPADWQPDETALLPSFGVERARELLMWLINLELRLPPYSEVSPA